MVGRSLILALVLFFVIGCKYIPNVSTPINLYGDKIEPYLVDEGELINLKINGYYYNIYRGFEEKEFISIIIFFNNGFSIATSLSFDGFKDVEKYLMSDYFLNRQLKVKPGNFKLESNKLINQYGPFGGDTFARHFETNIYEIKSKTEIELTEIFSLEHRISSKKYRFKDYPYINKLFASLKENDYFNVVSN